MKDKQVKKLNMPNINSLYELIKQKSQELGRPLKVISDWDECLFSFRATAIYNFASSEIPFKQFFEEFWEEAVSEPNDHENPSNPSASRKFIYRGKMAEFRKAYEDFEKLYKKRNKDTNKSAEKYKKLHVVDDQHILSTTEDLLKALKEGLVGELKIISASYVINKSQPSNIVSAKRKRFDKTFGQFPQCSFDIQEIEKVNGQNKPHRWEWIKENYPDFDIFIDDDSYWIKSVREHFPDRLFVINDYKYSRKEAVGDNIYHVKTTVSDLKDEDFAQAAEEYKQKKQTRSASVASPASNQEKEVLWKQPAFYWGLVGGAGICLLGIGIYWLVNWLVKRNKNG